MKLTEKRKTVLSIVLALSYITALLFLLRSVFISGYHFLLNPDEIFNANTVYLMFKGFRPYVDFYTVYSPILHWIISPVFLVLGFNFKAIYVTRVLMIILYTLRLALTFFLVKRVFNKTTALIFVFLFLLDPFMVFSAMQIRPENLMMVFYTLFLLVFSYAVTSETKKLNWLFFVSGLLCGLTLLTNIKIVPSLIAFGIVFLHYVFKNRFFAKLFAFVNGFCLAFLAFFAYFLIQGYLPEMFLHVFLDPFKLNNAILNPTWLGYFYFSNPTIYGLDGKPLNWIYAWALPVFAFAGSYKSLFNPSGNKVIKNILFISMILQWLSMLFIPSVFIQYYIPLNWLYAVFMAAFLDDILFRVNKEKIVQLGLWGITLIVFLLLFKTSLTANYNRSKWRDSYEAEFSTVWKMIPENSYVFPDVPFRKPIYPVLWGSTFAPYMRNRYEPVYLALDKYKLPILTYLHAEFFGVLDKESQDYILKHYKKDSTGPFIWRRVD